MCSDAQTDSCSTSSERVWIKVKPRYPRVLVADTPAPCRAKWRPNSICPEAGSKLNLVMPAFWSPISAPRVELNSVLPLCKLGRAPPSIRPEGGWAHLRRLDGLLPGVLICPSGLVPDIPAPRRVNHRCARLEFEPAGNVF